MSLGFSSSLAFVLGILLPIIGLVRSAMATEPDLPGFIADLMCGGMLLFGAIKTRQRAHTGQRFLAAGFALTFGVFYSSLMGVLKPQTVPIIGTASNDAVDWLIIPAIAGILVSGVGLLTSLRSVRPK